MEVKLILYCETCILYIIAKGTKAQHCFLYGTNLILVYHKVRLYLSKLHFEVFLQFMF